MSETTEANPVKRDQKKSAPTPKPTVSEGRYHEATESYEGWCKDCGKFTTDECEPDVRKRKCDECGAMKVYGAEEALLMGLFDLAGGDGEVPLDLGDL